MHRPTERRALALLALLSTLACGGGGPAAPVGGSDGGLDRGGTARPAPIDSTPLVLQNLGLVIAPYDPATRRGGDLDFGYDPFHRNVRPFYEFGITVSDPTGAPKRLGHYTFTSPAGTPVVAAVDGVVQRVFAQSGGDFEILVGRSANGSWILSYDHVVRLRVDSGARVRVGDTLAYAGGNAGERWMWELMLVSQHDGRFHCPWLHVAAEQRAAVAEQLAGVMRDWERVAGDTTVFDEAAMKHPGCQTDWLPAS